MGHPGGGPPFVLPNAYPIAGDVFPDGFRKTFAEHYTLETSGQWFDVWRCRRCRRALEGGKYANREVSGEDANVVKLAIFVRFRAHQSS